MNNLQEYLKLGIEALERAIPVLESYQGDAGVRLCEGRDIKTQADESVGHILESALAESGLPVLSEESLASHACAKEGAFWIIDPIDGTMNFVRGFPIYAISVALCVEGNPVLGIIYDALQKRIYSGGLEQGAHMNGQPFECSDVKSVNQGILATGFPVGRDFSQQALSGFIGFAAEFKKVRMLGSAAMSLAYVADGTLDYYCEEDIWLWDVAAGIALVKAAGGQVSVTRRKQDLRVTVLAGAPGVFAEASDLFERFL
ncbi:MAG: inositol monophosphatase family protein [Opitutales bacterium]